MKERPILFSAPMVRAILAGSKTQTRRVIKTVGGDGGFVLLDYGNGAWPYRSDDGDISAHTVKSGGKLYLYETPHSCPYGQPGDRLYVREGFSYTHGYTKDDVGCPVWYWADGNPEYGDFTPPKPSIHMPRWASRILLEVVSVRVERLNDISEDDAMAEGIVTIWPDGPRTDKGPNHYTIKIGNISYNAPTAKEVYSMLWDHINGVGAWEANHWVWVVEFKKVKV